MNTGCGNGHVTGRAFYCPADRLVYIDLGFFDELRTQFGAKDGPFVEAYVIAHEYGHHVQDLLGVLDGSETTTRGRGRLCARAPGRLLCRRLGRHAVGHRLIVELTAVRDHDGLDAAAAIGDDRIQERRQGQVNPETFTHGTSEQRRRWFSRGYETGKPAACDTFSGSI